MTRFFEAYARWLDQHVGIYGIEPKHLIAIGLIGMAVSVGMVLAGLWR